MRSTFKYLCDYSPTKAATCDGIPFNFIHTKIKIIKYIHTDTNGRHTTYGVYSERAVNNLHIKIMFYALTVNVYVASCAYAFGVEDASKFMCECLFIHPDKC